MKVTQNVQPPQAMLRFFRWFCHPDFQEDIEGDLVEMFQRKISQSGPTRAKLRFTLDVLKLFRPGIIRPLKQNNQFNHYGMFKNYIITAFRNMRKEKLFAAMNIAGLALGIGCGLVIYEIVSYELSYDTYQTHYRNIYRLINEYRDPVQGIGYAAGQVHPLGEALRNDFSGLDAVMTFYASEGQVTIENKGSLPEKYLETDGLAFAEPNIFKIFDFKFLAGNPATALEHTGSVVLTSALVQKYFKVSANEVQNVLGRSIILENKATLNITGVIADTPANTDLPFKIIANYKDQPASNPYYHNGTDWQEYNGSTNCYLLLSPGFDASILQQLLPAFQLKYAGKDSPERFKYLLQPFSELHSSSRVANYKNHQVTKPMLMALGLIGLFLILTAAINFINLSTAQAIKRSKEIGVRKAIGGSKRQLVLQHLGETLLTSVLSALAGLLIARMLFMYLENIIGYQLNIGVFSDMNTLLFLIGLVAAVGLLSGFYPALVMARMNPVHALKNSLSANSTSGLLSVRRSLVIVQFVISQVLIIGTLVIHLQMDYFAGKDLGFNKEAIVISKLPEGADSSRLALLKAMLVKKSSILKVSYGTRSPMAEWMVSNEINYPTLKPNENSGNLKTADEDYLDLYQLKLIAGRNYTSEKSFENAVVNRKLTQLLGFKDPHQAIGEKFEYGRNDLEFRIVGVVEDFHDQSLHNSIDNVILANVPFNIKEMAVKLNTKGATFSDIQQTLREIQAEWNNVFPERVFDYRFYDEQLHLMYRDQERISQLAQLFAAIAIFIGCLGLYAIISYVANQKTKEIGVRKVLGATVLDIQFIFSKEMLMLICIAFAIAAPVGYYVMSSWLQGFAYKITLSPLIFITAVLISVLIAAATIGYKSIKVSLINPVQSLKQE